MSGHASTSRSGKKHKKGRGCIVCTRVFYLCARVPFLNPIKPRKIEFYVEGRSKGEDRLDTPDFSKTGYSPRCEVGWRVYWLCSNMYIMESVEHVWYESGQILPAWS